MSTGRSADWPWRLLAVVTMALGLVTPLVAAAQGDLDEQARALAAQLRCPVCQNLSVADSSSELARDMRALIRAELQAGRSPEEIKAYFVSKYGDWILLSPRPRGLTWLLWLGPFAGAAAGLLVVARVARRWRRRPEPPPVVDPALLAQVRREVRLADGEAGPDERGEASVLERERNSLYAALRELDFDYRSGKLSDADFGVLRDDYEARAAAILAELARPRPPAPAPRARASRPAPAQRPRRRWRLAAASAFLLVFGVTVGVLLTQSIRPRTSERESITGDALTGTASAAAPGDLPALMASGRAAYERQEWRTAIDAFKQALALDPENPEAHTFLGLVLLQGGHGEDALRAIDRALARSPTYPMALWAKGIALFEGRGDYAGAIRVWEELLALGLDPRDADRVAAAITEARQNLAGRRTVPGGSPGPARAASGS